MLDKVQSHPAHTPLKQYQEPSTVAPRPTVTNAPGESETLKQYRRFFQTHDLSGAPHRNERTPR
jgi:hypothetical protein